MVTFSISPSLRDVEGERNRYYRVLLLGVILIGELTALVLFAFGIPFTSPYFVALNLGLLTSLSVLPLVLRLRTGSFNVAELGLWFTAFYFAHMVLGTLYVLQFGGPPINILPDDAIVGALSAGLSVATIGFVCFWFGYSLPIGYRTANRLPDLAPDWRHSRLPWIIAGCLTVGWTARITIMYLASGGILGWLATPATERFLGVPGTTYLKIIGELSSLAVFMLLTVAVRGRDWRFYFATALVLLPELGFQLLTGRRRAVPFLLLGMVMTVYLLSDRSYKQSVRYATAGISTLIIMVLMFPFVTVYRHEGALSLSAVAAKFQSLSLVKALGHRLIGSNTLSYLVHRVPDQVPHYYGTDFFLIPQTMVPRLLWPEKPQTSMGRLYTELIIPPGEYAAAEAVPPTLPGQLYWSANLAGVALGMVLVGIIWRMLNSYLVETQNHAGYATFVGIMFPSFFFVMEQDFIALFTKHFFRFSLIGGVIVLTTLDFRRVTSQPKFNSSLFCHSILQISAATKTSQIVALIDHTFQSPRLRATVTKSGMWRSLVTINYNIIEAISRLKRGWENSITRNLIKNATVYQAFSDEPKR
ncbi:hypothetical protein NGM10_11755 [Halorussus salilacus]|uniref:hypothetical protein n=1 Tax=Halorussus salilacus TaxID=2953750 RepID=UPI0020A09F4E|nr:hypothetical protein [Halorussus salilacus]USZ67400.1 hypothetical protein NGM10_11755 [Halorussus salilacus]